MESEEGKEAIGDLIKHRDKMLNSDDADEDDVNICQAAKDLADRVSALVMLNTYSGKRYTITISNKDNIDSVKFEAVTHEDKEIELSAVKVADGKGNTKTLGVSAKITEK